MFKEHHNRCMSKAREAEAKLRALMSMNGIVPERVRAVNMACVQGVGLDGRELSRDSKEIDRREDLQLLLNWQAMSTLGALPMIPIGRLIRASGVIPAPEGLDSRQQPFVARLTSACECSKR